MPAPGWYPQLDGRTQRYWDGATWTAHVAPLQRASVAAPARVPPRPASGRRHRTLMIGSVASLIGFAVGALVGGAGNDDGARTVAELRTDNASLDAKLEKAGSAAESKASEAAEAKEALDDALASAEADKDKAVAKAVRQERAKARRKIEAARREAQKARAFAGSAPAPQQTDPRFNTCAEANANGYGTYRRGADPEYDWYQDRDRDGVVCE